MDHVEASLKEEKAKNEKILVSHNVDLIDTAVLLTHHWEELNNFSKWQCDAQRRFFDLESKVNSLDLEVHLRDDQISSLEDTAVELRSLMEEMESRLCHCADKEGGRMLEEGEIEEPAVKEDLEYASDDSYRTPPVEVVWELCLIEDIPDHTAPSTSCGYSLEEPIVLSDEEETIVENKVPIPIQVKCHPAQDWVVHGQRAVHSCSGIHRTVPSIHWYCHGVDVWLNSGHELAKRLDHLKCGKHTSGSQTYATSDSGGDSNSSVDSGDSGTGYPSSKGLRLGRTDIRPHSGTPEVDRGRLWSNSGRGFVWVQGGLQGM